MPRFPARSTRRTSVLLAAVATLALPACRPAAPAFGTTPEAARRNADDFWGAWAARFTNVERTPKFAAARPKLSRYALAPSGVYDDASVWTSSTGEVRTLMLTGRLHGNRYVFDADATAGPPQGVGDSFHLMQLRRLVDDQWEWQTAIDMAAGQVTPDQLRDVERAVLASALRAPVPVLRAEYRTAFPHTTAAMGLLASLDSLGVQRLRDGSAIVDLRVSLHPERLRSRYPAFAQYLAKYVKPAKYSVAFSDRTGARWIVTTARDQRFSFLLRVLPDGRLAPLDGSVRPMPDTLVMRGDFSAKFSVFTVGVSDLTAKVAVLDTPGERGWHFSFDREPEWHLPLAVSHLIGTALRRPFDGSGMQLRLSARRRPDGQTVIARRVLVNVQEGAIVRWLGGLGAGAMDDLQGRAEDEEDRFLVDLFGALQDDFTALAARAQ